jgi:hypothetical protein
VTDDQVDGVVSPSGRIQITDQAALACVHSLVAAHGVVWSLREPHDLQVGAVMGALGACIGWTDLETHLMVDDPEFQFAAEAMLATIREVFGAMLLGGRRG